VDIFAATPTGSVFAPISDVVQVCIAEGFLIYAVWIFSRPATGRVYAFIADVTQAGNT
jgi:hypothetical protein